MLNIMPIRRIEDMMILIGHDFGIGNLCLSRDNSSVASCSSGCYGDPTSIIIHSTKTGIVEYRAVFVEDVLGLCYLPNGSLVACGFDHHGETPT